MGDPVLTVMSEVLWPHIDQVLGEAKIALHRHGEDEMVSAINASAADVATVFAAMIEPGDPLTEICPACGSYPTHACVDGVRRARMRVAPHAERKAARIRRILADTKETA
jgi:hypothetical protein